jgi:hypothetical protein
MAEHYIRSFSLAANLQPVLSKYNLVGALNPHFPIDFQKCMISANLKSKQDALAFLGNLQAMEVSKDTNRRLKQE